MFMFFRPLESGINALTGLICLLGGGSMAFVIFVVMFRNSMHFLSLWLLALLLSALALYGLWVLRMAFPASRSGGGKEGEAGKAAGSQGA